VTAVFVPGATIAVRGAGPVGAAPQGIITEPNGITCFISSNPQRACVAPYAPGVLVTPQSASTLGWYFAGWSALVGTAYLDGCYGLDPCAFVMPGVTQGQVLLTAAFTQGTAMTKNRHATGQVLLTGSAGSEDSIQVQFAGVNAAGATWTATASGHVALLTTAGTGTNWIHFNRSVSGAGQGTYWGNITISSPGVADLVHQDSLVVAAAILGVAPAARVDSLPANSVRFLTDSATISLSGAATTAWVATHRPVATWLTLITPSGQGSGTLRWKRSAAQLTPGLHVDTLTVAAAGAVGSPAILVDTFQITAPGLALTPGSRHDSLIAGSMTTHADSATLSLTGFGADSVAWTANHGSNAPWVTLATVGGVGSGVLLWTRQAAGLAAGVYVDTIRVLVPGGSAVVIDSLTVLQALTLALPAGSRRDSAVVGATEASLDSLALSLSGVGGVGSSSAPWTAGHGGGAWLVLTTGAGVGSGWLRWTRNPTGLPLGTYVDTITVNASGALGTPAQMVDTFLVLAPLSVTAAPAGRWDSLFQGSTTARPDSATVTLTGYAASSTRWSASHGGSTWLSLTTASGTGSGKVRWSVNPTGVAAGLYVDTIAITASGAIGSPARILDTLRVAEPPIALTCAENVLLVNSTCLGGVERNYLDQTGNRNQGYDLGDLLSYLDRKGLQLSAPGLAALTAYPRKVHPTMPRKESLR